jgi:hypothetical protein
MNARHTLIQDLRAALDETAARLTDLLTPAVAGPRQTRVAVAKVFAAPATPVSSAHILRRYALVFALAAVAGSLAGTANAGGRGWADTWVDGNLVDVQIQVDGQAAPLYVSPRGDLRHYLEAFAGRNYSVVLRNNTARRIGVLLTVDGLNVVNGERTRQASDEPMYVLGPWESATIQGWRTSLNDVRRFVFVDEKRSYAERTGQANADMGWIRVLAFREQRPIQLWGRNQLNKPQTLPWVEKRDDNTKGAPESDSEPRAAAPAPTTQPYEAQGDASGKAMASREESRAYKDEGGSFPGTGWGDQRQDRVQVVDFKPERAATDLIVFRYEYERGLVALGIFPDRDRLHERDRGGLVGFAKPPRW